MSEFTLRIENMHCGACIGRVSQVLSAIDGIQVKEVRLGAARLQTSETTPPIELAVAALANAGHPAQLEQ